ncbi:MAG: hypothetical protein BWK73_34505 [Thiothrix lacustris]|uniref:Conjugal transfer protein TrbC n=1 Tax=Thiothrix lacustris TaxID=525917 RepID=A0A1Y1QGH7_9GAMM|nr:MAG: hypothetical protein BWK73_34505 [Thiothrix lacustris]
MRSKLLLMPLFWLLAAFSDVAFAGAAGGMPWETPLETVMESLTGPTAGFIALIGVFAAGAALIFGGEMAEFTRKIVMIILLVSLMMGGAALMGTLGFATGAVVAGLPVVGLV